MVTNLLFVQCLLSFFFAFQASSGPIIWPERLLPLALPDMEHASRRSFEENPWVLPITPNNCPHPRLPFLQEGSVSHGTVVAGCVKGGVVLPPQGPNHAVLQNLRGRDVTEGTEELVNLVQTAAAAVAKDFPGAVLGVGNLGRRGGGPIPWSISHQAGRDVDLAYYLTDPRGAYYVPPEFQVLAPPLGTLQAGEIQYTFDPKATWRLVKALLTDSSVKVQSIFAARFLIEQMTPFAAADGPQFMTLLKENVRQPHGALPHDDHMHVRIACSATDLAEGCVDIVRGRRLPSSSVMLEKNVARARRLLRSKEQTRRIEALAFLAEVQRQTVPAYALPMLSNRDPRLRQAALRALLQVGKAPPPAVAVRLLKKEQDPEVAALLLSTIRKAPKVDVHVVQALLRDRRHFKTEGLPELSPALLGARLAATKAETVPVKDLLPLLDDEDPLLSIHANKVLAFLYNHSVEPVPDEKRAVTWTRWIKENGRAALARPWEAFPGCEWLRGDKLRLCLAPFVADPDDRISFNAQRLLQKLCRGRGPGISLLRKDRQAQFWAAVARRCR